MLQLFFSVKCDRIYHGQIIENFGDRKALCISDLAAVMTVGWHDPNKSNWQQSLVWEDHTLLMLMGLSNFIDKHFFRVILCTLFLGFWLIHQHAVFRHSLLAQFLSHPFGDVRIRQTWLWNCAKLENHLPALSSSIKDVPSHKMPLLLTFIYFNNKHLFFFVVVPIMFCPNLHTRLVYSPWYWWLGIKRVRFSVEEDHLVFLHGGLF